MTWEPPKLAAGRSFVAAKLRSIKLTRSNIRATTVSSAQWCEPLAPLGTVCRPLWIYSGSCFSICSSWLAFTPQRENRGGISCINLLDFIKECEPSSDGRCSCIHARPLFAMPHHTLILNWRNWSNREQISQLVNSARRVWLRRMKGLPFPASMGFIRCVTLLRLRHRSSEHVNLRTGTQTLPPPSLSARISLTSRTSPPLTSAPLHFPL